MRRFGSVTSNFTARKFTGLMIAALLLLPALCYAAPTSAYMYVGWYLGQWPNFAEYVSGYAVAADGSIQPLPGFPVGGPSFGLVAVRNFIIGDDGLHHVTSYTRGSDGSLRETSTVDEYQYAPQGEGMNMYALNPDRAGQVLNTVISCGSCNSYILSFAIGSDGQLSFVGGPLPPGGPAKWDGVFFFSPADDYAYTNGWGEFTTLRHNPDGSLTGLYSWPLPQQPVTQNWQENQVCYPGDVASSSTGYVAMVWWGSQYWCDDFNTGYVMGTYTVGANGYLELVPNTGFTPQVLEISMAFDPSGSYLAIAGCLGQGNCEGHAALQIYKLQSDSRLTPVGDMVTIASTDRLDQVQWDNAGHLYAWGDAVCCRNGLVISPLYIYNFDGQNLTLAPDSPHMFANAVGLAVAPPQ
ncbi:MAG TPA: hypothetical protein VL240_05840 [Candidatus Binatia bacterium]|nr:hypothetical protein [Candidatus Binatia bacterium]